MSNFDIRQGDVLDRLCEMPDESVNCCVTSPPYYGLRNYGVAGQIGLEATPELFISRLVEVFREVRRVLRSDGTCWINIGDSYAQGGPGGASSKSTLKNDGRLLVGARNQEQRLNESTFTRKVADGLKPKDLIGVPWMLAFALRADGWFLRQDIIWHKPNPMPESVRDRCTKAHEYVFLLTKSGRYAYDCDAVREKAEKGAAGSRFEVGKTGVHQLGRSSKKARLEGSHGTTGHDGNGMRMAGKWDNPLGRNKRSVWTMATQPTPDAHFATFPLELPETCILAGCPEGGTVLDPFSGAGTTGLAALKHGRSYVGIELNPEYIAISHARLGRHCPLLGEIA